MPKPSGLQINSSKRASLPRNCEVTRKFGKDWVRLTHSGRYNMGALKAAMLALIANDQPLPPQYLDHALQANGRTSASATLVVTFC